MSQNTTPPPSSLLLPMGRRGLLKGGAAMASSLAMPWVSRANADAPIQIGMVWAKNGPLSGQGQYLAQGGLLALQQRKNMLMGKPAEIIWLDETSPQSSAQNAAKLMGEDKVVGVVGGVISAFALAIAPVAEKMKIPFIAANGAADEITGVDCNKYTFRSQPPVHVHREMFGPYCKALGKKWYLITAAYAYGQDIRKEFADYAKENGIEIVGSDEVPLSATDYSSYILKIRAAKPDVVVGGIVGGGLTAFLKQWEQLGMRGKIPFAEISIGCTDIWGVGPKAADGLFTMTWYYRNKNNSLPEQQMAADYLAAYKRPAADKAWMGWIAMKSLLDSIEAAKSTKPAAIVEALEHWSMPRGDINLHYRTFDHQMINRALVVKVKPKITDQWDYFVVLAELPKTPAEVEAVYGTQAASACKMGPV